MTVLLAESFDPYGSAADMDTAGWVHGNQSLAAATPFTQGQSFQVFNNPPASYNWGSNEATIYGSLYYCNKGTSSSTNYVYLSFMDGATAQCTIRMNMDGSIGLYSGGPAGTLISTTTAVFTGGVSTTWSSLQFKVVINSSGSIEIRANGSPTNAITQTSVNTRAGTSNVYANGLSFGAISGTGLFDNLYLTNSGWPGEMRGLQQLPTVISGSPSFSAVASKTQRVLSVAGSTGAIAANVTNYIQFVASVTGPISSATFTMISNLTGNVKVAIYDSTGTGGTPGTALASAAVSNPLTTTNTATFSSPPTLVVGAIYYLAWDQDASATYGGANLISFGNIGYTATTTYASFPVNNPSVGSALTSTNMASANLIFTATNAAAVQDLIQDGDTSYIYTSSNVEDQYHLTAIPATYTVTAVQYYACWKKTDAGTRTASLSITANGSSDTNIVTVIPPFNAYGYTIRTTETDPTGAAWTPTNVNNAIIGVIAGS